MEGLGGVGTARTLSESLGEVCFPLPSNATALMCSAWGEGDKC